MLKKSLLFFAALFTVHTYVFAQQLSLKSQLNTIIQSKNASIGIAVQGPGDQNAIIINANHRFPMQSVYKFPLALAVLKQVDEGKLALNQKIKITKADLLPTYSPMRDKYPEGGVELSLADVISYSVSLSDNNACDILFRLIGGTAVADQYVKSLGVKNMAITTTEEEAGKGWDVQYSNYSTPGAMLQVVELFRQGKLLSATSNAFLKKAMTATSTGNKRLKGQLPAQAIVAHKTGTSGTNKEKLTPATNDAGIVTGSDQRSFSIVVYVSDSKETTATNEAIIAEVAKCVWDYYKMK